MNTTAFITRFFKSSPERAARYLSLVHTSMQRLVRPRGSTWFAAFFTVMLLCGQTSRAAEVSQVSIARAEDGVYLSTIVQFDLPPALEDALTKGIPMFFVAQADTYQNRWYWKDKRVASATRTIRLAFQPLSRRWRVNIVSGVVSNSAGLRATLNQNYDSLPEAMSAVQRLSRWRIADNTEIEPDTAYRMEFTFDLDLSQLPRPFQIGVVGQKDWTINATHNERVQLSAFKPLDKPKPAAANGVDK